MKNPGKYLHRPSKTIYPEIGQQGRYGEPEELISKTTGLPTGMAVTWLGTSSGSPTLSRNVSSILLRLPNKTLVFDAGEGTQTQVIKANIFPSTIRRIFVTHLHGDHCFGLPALLALMNQIRMFHDRGEMLYVHGPPGLGELVRISLPYWFERFRMSITIVEFTMDPKANTEPQAIDPNGHVFIQKMLPTSHNSPSEMASLAKAESFEEQLSKSVKRGFLWEIDVGDGTTVTAAQLQHRVPCWGYVVKEPDYIPEMWELDLWKTKNQALHLDKVPSDAALSKMLSYTGRKVVILGDTCNSDAILKVGQNADLLSHEATFAGEMHNKAIKAQHSTATMAGTFARKLNAKKLILTHFSARYQSAKESNGQLQEDHDDVCSLIEEAKQAFRSSSVEAAHDFVSHNIPSNQKQISISAKES